MRVADGTHFRFVQRVEKPLRDTQYSQVVAHRYQCLRCWRTHRVYPIGVSQDHISISVANTSNVALHATITDTLPFSVTIDKTSGNTVTLPNGSKGITWTATITAPRGVWKETIVVTVEEDCERPLVNVVEVTTAEGAAGNTSIAVNLYKVYMPLLLRGYVFPTYAPARLGTDEDALQSSGEWGREAEL
jgi:hypothetical protein